MSVVRDLRELELAGFVPNGYPTPSFVVDGIEYWSPLKLYRFDNTEHLAQFITYLAVENDKEGSDVAIGPYYDAEDETGHLVDVPVRVEDPLIASTYYTVGEASQDLESKRAAFRKNSNDWDGVAQLAMMATRV